MYLWLAIDIDEQLRELRHKAEEITERLGSSNPALTLPLHISLRISFPIADETAGAVINRVGEYYAALTSFVVAVLELEKNGNIVWIRMQENSELKQIHEDLVEILRVEFGVQPHSFDLDFKYHSSLFIDNDASKVDEAYAYLRQVILPQSVRSEKFTIGCSETGRAGEFRVTKEFWLQNGKGNIALS